MQISQLFLPEVSEAIKNGDLEGLRAVFGDLHPSDVAELLAHLTPENIARCIHILRASHGIPIFEQLDLHTQAAVLGHLGRAETVKILEELSPDDRVDLLKKLPQETVDSFLPLMAQAERDDVRGLLQYGENTAGALMTTEYASLPVNITVADAWVRLRTVAPDAETIYYVYITDTDRHLLGTVSMRDLLIGRPTQTIDEIISRDAITVEVNLDREEVAKIFAKYDLLALPVVDAEKRLVGIITHDDVLDVMVKEQTEDAHMMGAVEPLEEPYFQSSFWAVARKRGFWLMFIFLGELLTGTAMRHYHHVFVKAETLIFFLPLILSSGGNSGSQSVTLITRGLAVGDVRLADFFKVFWRENAMGLVLGGFLGTVGIVRALMWHTPWDICLSVGVALIGVVLSGTLIGAILPLSFKRAGFDPAIMSAPLVASVVDVTGIVIYFTVAGLMMS